MNQLETLVEKHGGISKFRFMERMHPHYQAGFKTDAEGFVKVKCQLVDLPASDLDSLQGGYKIRIQPEDERIRHYFNDQQRFYQSDFCKLIEDGEIEVVA